MSFFFNDFFSQGGGGHGHHFHGQQPEAEEPIDTEGFYKLLGISKSATQDEIKKAYRKKARALHPDRHTDEREKYQAMFQDVQRANEVLKDPQKRALYDKYGEKGVKRGGGGGSGSSLFDMFSGQQSRAQESHGPKKSPSIKSVLPVTLEDIYKGSTKKIMITRRVVGKGGKNATCSKCHGQGQITKIQRMGPMVLQQRAACPLCAGIGYKLEREEHEVIVHVPIGGKDRETVTVPGEGNMYPDHNPGDILLQLKLEKHPIFKRQGADLGMTYSLSLRQALCGYKIKIKHVSGKILYITPGDPLEIIQPGSLQVIHTLGLPQRFSPHVKGHLYIVMDVVMPKTLKPSLTKQLKQLLPNTNVNDDDSDYDEEKIDNKKTNNNNNNNQKKPQNQTKSNKNKKNQYRNKNKKKGKGKKNRKKSGGAFGGLAGAFAKNKGGKNKNNQDKEPMDQDDDSDDMIEEVDAHTVDGNPKATPAAASNYYQEDEEDGDVQCKQM